MNSPLSQNELIILDRQMALIARHLSEIASLIESRQGETDDTAVSARIIEKSFTDLARKIHSRAAHADRDAAFADKSQNA